MELTPEEARLIESLREIDRQNPAGIDGYTTAFYLAMVQDIITGAGAAAEAGRRYRLFLNQTKGKVVDLREAQRSKERFEDLRAREEDKAEYERIYQRYGLPAPIWKHGTAHHKKAAAGPRKSF